MHGDYSQKSFMKVLFLCTGNYYRSRLAEELFNHAAQATGLSWRASSRGLARVPSPENIGPMSIFSLQALADRGIRPTERMPIVCQINDLTSANLVVALKEAEHRVLLADRFPGWDSRVTYWHVHDIDVGDPAEAVAMVDELIGELISELRSNSERRT
jgi:low molecular weight protein-tyrosine phosphatase